MRAAILAFALLLAACPAPDAGSPPELAACLEIEAAEHYEPPAPGSYVLIEDVCIGECLADALTTAGNMGLNLALTRGREYRYGGAVYMPAGLELVAVGDSAAPRPVVWGDSTALGISLGPGGAIRNIETRGPRYGQTDYPVRLHEDWAHKGINGGGRSGWTVSDVIVDGFPGTCLLAGESDDIAVVNSAFRNCGYSGVSLFPGEPEPWNCGTGVRFTGNVLENNGQNGIDACSSEAVYADNVFRGNGWGQLGGDQNGLLLFSGSIRGVEVTGNLSCANRGDGYRVSAEALENVAIELNGSVANRGEGYRVGHWEGEQLTDVVVRGNASIGDVQCVNPAAGVEAADNLCRR